MTNSETQILIYAGAPTTTEADKKYRSQAAACLGFISTDDLSSLDNQSPVSAVTSSPVRSNRSDLVPDSQRHVTRFEHNQDKYSQAQHGGKLQSSARFETSKILSIQDVFEKSCLQFTDFQTFSENELTDKQAVNAQRKQLSPHETPTIGHLTTEASIPAGNAEPVHDSRSKIYVADGNLALQALLLRENSALQRRRSRFSGLQSTSISRPSETDQHFAKSGAHNSSKGSVAGIATLPSVLKGVENSTVSTVVPGGPSEVQFRDVNKQLVVTTASTHGASRTPSADERTTHPSGQTDQPSIEQDTSLKLHEFASSAEKRRNYHNISSIGKRRNLADADHSGHRLSDLTGSFTAAQLVSPFYQPTFEVISTTSPGNAQSQADKGGRHHNSTIELASRYSDASLVQILGTALEKNHDDTQLCPAARNVIFRSEIDHGESRSGSHAKTDNSLKSVQSTVYVTSRQIDIAPGLLLRPDLHSHASNIPLVQSVHLQSAQSDGKVLSSRLPEELDQIILASPCSHQPAHSFIDGNQSYALHVDKTGSGPPLFSPFLQGIKIPNKVKKICRALRPLERGHWRIALKEFEFTLAQAKGLWEELSCIIRDRDLYWISMHISNAEVLRVYCYAQSALPVWVLIYAVCGRIIKESGISWLDASGIEVLRN